MNTIVSKKYQHKPIEYEIDDNDCWICTSHKLLWDNRLRISIKNKDNNYRSTICERIAYEEIIGELDRHENLVNICGNLLYINPSHYKIKTEREDHKKSIEYTIDKNGCWNCISHFKNKKGYPHITINNKSTRLSRYMYESYRGEIPEGKIIMHLCDNPSCINPDHLKIGTHTENIKDRDNKGRAIKGEKCHNSKLKEKDIREIRISTLSTKELSIKFNVSDSNIRDIRNRKAWKHVN